MTWIDHGRRAASVVLVVLALVAAPVVAQATFAASSSGGLSAGTAQLVAPTAVTGTYRCAVGFSTESFQASVTGFTDTGPAGATYRYTLARGTTTAKTLTSTARTATLDSGNVTSDNTTTRWTVTIQATLGLWTGPLYTRTVTCGTQNSSGSL
ncbi:hypothetical protein [Nocardioides aquiterrae]|uniref:Uncharacterized protein n=1 Tax=Nocardioides aquiterrae TaxID=203799 RepID=A0ABN1UFR7_9ACTN